MVTATLLLGWTHFPLHFSRAAISLKKGPALHHPKLPGVQVWLPSGEDGGDQPQAGTEQKVPLEEKSTFHQDKPAG